MTRRTDDELVDAVARECIANKVRLLNRAVTAIYDEALRPHGIKITQMIVLVTVAKLEAPGPGALGRALHMEKSTLSRTIDRLRARGWLETVPADDGRSQVLRVTPRGRKLLRETHAAWTRAQERAARILGAEGVAGLGRSVTQLARARSPRT